VARDGGALLRRAVTQGVALLLRDSREEEDDNSMAVAGA